MFVDLPVYRIECDTTRFPSPNLCCFFFLPNEFTPGADGSVPPPKSPCCHLLDSLHQGPVPGHCWLKSALSLTKTNYTLLCLISFCCFHPGSVLNRSGVHEGFNQEPVVLLLSLWARRVLSVTEPPNALKCFCSHTHY